MRWSGTPVTFEMMCIMSSAGHDHFLLFALFAPFGQNGIELFLGLLFLVAKRGGLLEILCFDRRFLLHADFFDFLLDILHVRRPVMALMRARAPASSMTSIALSGRKRPVI